MQYLWSMDNKGGENYHRNETFHNICREIYVAREEQFKCDISFYHVKYKPMEGGATSCNFYDIVLLINLY